MSRINDLYCLPFIDIPFISACVRTRRNLMQFLAADINSHCHAVEHLAVWAGMYVASAVVSRAQLTEVDRPVSPELRGFIAAALAFCTAAGVYLLDRANLRNAWLDL